MLLPFLLLVTRKIVLNPSILLTEFMLWWEIFNLLGYISQNYFTLLFSLEPLEISDIRLHQLLEFLKTFYSSIKDKFPKSSFQFFITFIKFLANVVFSFLSRCNFFIPGWLFVLLLLSI